MAIITTIRPTTTKSLVTPVIAIVMIVPGAVSDGRSAENAKRKPGSDPAASCLVHQYGVNLGGLDACEARHLGVGGALNSQGEKRSAGYSG